MNVIENGHLFDSLYESIRDGASGLKSIPRLVVKIVELEAWRKFFDPKFKREVEHDTFESYVTSGPPRGLGSDLRTLKNICRDDRAALDAIDRVTRAKPGEGTERGDDGRFTPFRTGQFDGQDQPSVDNVNERANGRPDGNTASRALRTLRDKRPDLHAEVLAGELSPHAAMVAAGFRPKTATVPISDARAAVRALLRRFDAGEIRAALDALDPDRLKGEILDAMRNHTEGETNRG